MSACVICGLEGVAESQRRDDAKEYKCTACGVYVLTGTAIAILPALFRNNPDARPLLSHLFRIRNPREIHNTTPISSDELGLLVEGNKPPTPAEQCQNLIGLLGERTKPGEDLALQTDEIRTTIGAQSSTGLVVVASHLYANGSIDVLGGTELLEAEIVQAKLTVPGWIAFQELQSTGKSSRTAFMAMQFNDSEAERAFREAFMPAAVDCGFALQRLDEQQPAGLIDDQLRVRIRNAAFVVADITRGNLGAYWEAGFAEGLGKPVIYTCEGTAFGKGTSHFDTNHHLTVQWSLDKLDDAKRRMTATIRATLPGIAKMID